MSKEIIISGNFRINKITDTTPDLERLTRALEERFNDGSQNHYFIGFEDQLSDDKDEILESVRSAGLAVNIVDSVLVISIKSLQDLRSTISLWALHSGGAELYALVKSSLEIESFIDDLKLFLREGEFKNSRVIAKDAGDGDNNLFVIFNEHA